ncbi:hypothetical protein [Roseovarius sp.]|uniref:hypothetical protein n=1 Tax=Roseovarius sp. TaxID=1486281 RepID=UPI003A982947
MNLKSRMKRIERKAGLGSGVTILYRRTVLEDASGEVDAVSMRAVIVRPNQKSECVFTRENESDDQFRERVDRISKFQETNEQSERTRKM